MSRCRSHQAFRNRPDLRFEGRIHEQISLRFAAPAGPLPGPICTSSTRVPTPALRPRRKRRRDLHLLHLELLNAPTIHSRSSIWE